jgi:transcriptional regulator with XRE-family HTH domain
MDFDMPFDRGEMNVLIDSGLTMKEVSENLGISPSTLREYRHIIEQEQDDTIEPYLDRIKGVMEDRDLSEQMTRSVTVDGLAEAIDITEADMADMMQ